MTEFRARIDEFLERSRVRQVIIGVIIFNAIILGMETSKGLMADYGDLILAIDRACLAFFVAEIALKLFARGGGFSAMAGASSI